MNETLNIKIVQITPDYARELLKGNQNNRNLKEKAIIRYAADMKSGLWKESSMIPIYISENGELKDGQHRLHAIIRSGATITAPIITVPDDASCYDLNVSRNANDEAKIRGYNFSKFAVQTASALMRTQNSKRSISQSAIVEYCVNHQEDLVKAADFVEKNRVSKSLTRNAAFGLLAYYCVRFDESMDALLKFRKVLDTGYTEEPIDATAVTARNMLLLDSRKRDSKGGTRLHYYQRNVIHHAFYDYMQGIIRKRAYKSDEAFTLYIDKLLEKDLEEIKGLIGK